MKRAMAHLRVECALPWLQRGREDVRQRTRQPSGPHRWSARGGFAIAPSKRHDTVFGPTLYQLACWIETRTVQAGLDMNGETATSRHLSLTGNTNPREG